MKKKRTLADIKLSIIRRIRPWPFSIGITNLWPGTILAYEPDRYSENLPGIRESPRSSIDCSIFFMLVTRPIIVATAYASTFSILYAINSSKRGCVDANFRLRARKAGQRFNSLPQSKLLYRSAAFLADRIPSGDRAGVHVFIV